MAEREFPSNANAVKDDRGEPEKAVPVTVGTARKAHPLGRIFRTVLEDGVKTAKHRAIEDIIMPGLQTMVYETLNTILQGIIFGSSETPSTRKPDRISYNEYSKYGGRSGRRHRDTRRISYIPDEIVVDSREEAHDILRALDREIRTHGRASVAHFYELAKVDSAWTDNRYGWTDIRDADVRKVAEGFVILMPIPMELEY